MAEKHTPGPWHLADAGGWSADHDSFGTTCYEAISGKDGDVVALAVARGAECFADVDSRADARLIAAAPELLDALAALVLNIDAGGPTLGVMKDARAAIAKATGATSAPDNA